MNVLLSVIHTRPCPPYPKLHITISNTLHTIRQWMSGLRPVQYSTIDLVLSSVCGTPLILCVVFVVFLWIRLCRSESQKVTRRSIALLWLRGPYVLECRSQNAYHSLGCKCIKLIGSSGNCFSVKTMPRAFATGHVRPTLLPPSEQLASDSTHSHQQVVLRAAKRKCKAKVMVPASNWREEPFTMLHRTPILSM